MQSKLHTETDNYLRDLVLRQLEWEPGIQAQDIAVTAKDGTVNLSGSVHTYLDKTRAEQAARSVYGVKAIANNIEVKGLSRTDPEIARDCVEAFRIDVGVPETKIKAEVSQGFVTLEGTVDWNFQRVATEKCARKVAGVRGIINKIQIKPRVSPTEVKTKIEDALRRSAELDARRISVAATDGTVTLSGNVRSFAEREQAERAAWAAPGVMNVVDHISISL